MSFPEMPVGLLVSATAKVLSREFDAALTAVGGSRPTWLVLSSLKSEGHRTQGELAEAVGIRQPTLSHHLDGLEREGLVRRERTADHPRGPSVTAAEAG